LQDDLRTAFLAYFKVGQSSGKSLKHFDELMQASHIWLPKLTRVVAVTMSALCSYACALGRSVTQIGQRPPHCLLQAMDEDQDGDTVEWKKVFEEDREFNQG
jgi:hypothetical protein